MPHLCVCDILVFLIADFPDGVCLIQLMTLISLASPHEFCSDDAP